MNSPFTPSLKVAKAIERFRQTPPSLDQAHLIPKSTSIPARTIKTPPVELPNFDGLDFEAFLKNLPRWIR